MDTKRKILVLGASGLIGRFVTDDLRARGFEVVGVARKLSASQIGALDLELPIMSMDAPSLAAVLRDRAIDVVVNCLGVLQDGPGSDTGAVHRDFVARLLQATRESGRAIRLVHISIPGNAATDRTAFATTKREAERLVAASGVASAILRPGFVVAPAAFGGSAMLRALVVLPIDLPADRLLAFLVNICTRDLAYGVETGPIRTAEATTMLAQLVDVLGPDARWWSNCDLSYVSRWSEHGKPSPLSWNPLTHYTFDRAIVGTGSGGTVTFLAVAED